jgi:hypothetical protein
MKILNLDSFAKEDRVLTIDGIQHKMKEMSVEDYIELNNKAEQMDEAESQSTVTSVEFMMESISKIFPTATKEILVKRSMNELAYISSFARGELDEQLKLEEQTAVATGAARKKK